MDTKKAPAVTYAAILSQAEKRLKDTGGSPEDYRILRETYSLALERNQLKASSPCDYRIFLNDCFCTIVGEIQPSSRCIKRVEYAGARMLLDAFAHISRATEPYTIPEPKGILPTRSILPTLGSGNELLQGHEGPTQEAAKNSGPVLDLPENARETLKARTSPRTRGSRCLFHVRVLPGTKQGESRWEVSGVLNGRQKRLRYRRKADADEKAHRLNLEARGGSVFRETITTLADNILRDAEAAHRLLSSRYPATTFTDTVSFYLTNYKPCGSEHTVLTALEPFLDSRRAKERSVRQVENYKYRLKRFAAHVPDRLLHEITRGDVTNFLNANPKWAAASWNGYYADILAFFNWCKHEDRKWVSVNPAQGLDRKPKTHREVQILDLESCRKLMDYVDQLNEPAVAMIFALGLFTGIRPDFKNGEFSELGKKVCAGKTDRHFRMDTKELFLSSDMTKDKRNRYTDLYPNLLAWLKKYPPTPESFSEAVIDRYYGEIRKRFKIPHDGLRHTYISAYSRLYGMADAALQAGNSVEIIREHYYRRMSKAEAKAFWKIMPSS